jgi:hypothetical protein
MAKYYGLQPSVMQLHAEKLQVSHRNKGIPGMVQLLFQNVTDFAEQSAAVMGSTWTDQASLSKRIAH